MRGIGGFMKGLEGVYEGHWGFMEGLEGGGGL